MTKKVHKFPSTNYWKRRDQLLLPSVRESKSNVVMQQEQDVGNNLRVQPFSSQHVDNKSNSQERRLAYNPLQVMSPNQVIPIDGAQGVTFNVPDLPFSQAQRNEIFSEMSSRIYRELRGPECVTLQQNNILQQIIQEFHVDPIQGTLSEQQEYRSDCCRNQPTERRVGKAKIGIKAGFRLY